MKSDLNGLELEVLLEAARRATWDALHGPEHLRSGRFDPSIDDNSRSGEAAQLDAAADKPRDSAAAKQDQPRAPRD